MAPSRSKPQRYARVAPAEPDATRVGDPVHLGPPLTVGDVISSPSRRSSSNNNNNGGGRISPGPPQQQSRCCSDSPWFVPALALFYIPISGSLSVYNKHVFSEFLPAPVFFLICTTTILWSLCAALRLISAASGGERFACASETVDAATFLRRVAPVGLVAACEISASNLGLLRLSLSFQTMLRATIPGFIICISAALGLQPCSGRNVCVALLLIVGTALSSVGEFEESASSLNRDGVALVLGSCFCAGLKWCISQRMLQGSGSGGGGSSHQQEEYEQEEEEYSEEQEQEQEERKKLHPISAIFYVAPTQVLALLPICIYSESDTLAAPDIAFQSSSGGTSQHFYISRLSYVLYDILYQSYLTNS